MIIRIKKIYCSCVYYPKLHLVHTYGFRSVNTIVSCHRPYFVMHPNRFQVLFVE